MLLASMVDHMLSGAAGGVLGFLTGIWLHALWKRLHPTTIRFWGTWYTDRRLFITVGVALGALWLVFFFNSLD
ncbi:MAG TPA: hypothetical protein VHV08_06885 [Pirellulales bacterium]|nr:hypothetical protein [Pirellulales bacterium]